MAETLTVSKWLFSRLTSDSTLAALIGARVFFGIAPAGAAAPYVVMELRSGGNDLLTLGAYRIWSDELWRVKSISKGASGLALESIVDRIDALLHNASATTADGSIWASVRETSDQTVIEDSGVFYSIISYDYRIKVRDF